MADRNIDIKLIDGVWNTRISDNFGNYKWSSNFPIVYFPSNETDKKVKFTIVDAPRGVAFVEGAGAAGVCEHGGGQKSSGSYAAGFSGDGKKNKCTIHNDVTATRESEFDYALYFTGAPTLDPIIRNGGDPGSVGSSTVTSAAYSTTTLFISALAIAGIAAFVGYQLALNAVGAG
jgi:hypothetical protein